MRRKLLALILIAAAPLVGAAENWVIDHDRSELGFTFTQEGREVDGRFRSFSADMRFAADDLAGSRFDVTVDVASAETGSRQRDRALPDREWFHAETYPHARFTTTDIRRADGGYEAVGELRIRDSAHRIVLPFDWQTRGDSARMTGRVTIDRTRYGVGQGEWTSGDTVGHDVTVRVDLTLHRSGG